MTEETAIRAKARLDASMALRRAMGSLQTVSVLVSEACNDLVHDHPTGSAPKIIGQTIETLGRTVETLRYAQARLEGIEDISLDEGE